MPLAPRVLAQQSTATPDDRLSWVGCQPLAPHTPSRKVLILRTPYTTRTGDMQDPATELPRMPLPRTRVNKGMKKGQCLGWPLDPLTARRTRRLRRRAPLPRLRDGPQLLHHA